MATLVYSKGRKVNDTLESKIFKLRKELGIPNKEADGDFRLKVAMRSVSHPILGFYPPSCPNFTRS
jgi:hypothetical protein